MDRNHFRISAATIAALLLCAGALAACPNTQAGQKEATMTLAQTAGDPDLVGMWVTSDGHIRLELLPDGRYDEARGERRSAYRGRWVRRGATVAFFDDSGFTATGTIGNGVLTAGPDRFRKE